MQALNELRERLKVASNDEIRAELVKIVQAARDLKLSQPIQFYVPNRKQIDFHKSLKVKRWFVAANGAGKSNGGVCEDIYWATGHHPYREVPTQTDGWVNTQSISAQTQAGGVQEKFQKYFPKNRIARIQRGTMGAWSRIIVTCFYCSAGDDGELRCRECGRKLSTIALKTYEQSLDIFAGGTIDYVHHDEEPPELIRDECLIRLRKPTGGWEWGTMTPVKGLSWTYPRIGKPFLDALKRGQDHPEIDVITASMFDNIPNITEEYIKRAIADCGDDKTKYRIRILGEWTTLSGLVFPYWDPDKNEFDDLNQEFLTPEGKIHSDYDTYVGVDTGYNFAATFILSDYFGNLWLFDEFHAEKMPTPQIAKELKRKCAFWGINPTYVIDKASSADVDFAEYGIYCMKALSLTREEGNEIVGGYIAARGREGGKPMLIACRSRVPEYLRQLSVYQHAPALKSGPNQGAQKADVVKRDDHGLDAARFVITMRPAPSRPSPDRDSRPLHVKTIERVKERFARKASGDDEGGISIYEDVG